MKKNNFPYEEYQSRKTGLQAKEVEERLQRFGPNQMHPPKKGKWFFLFLDQFKSPIIVLLIIAAILSFFLSAPIDGSIICTIIFCSGLLGFFQEKGALNALEKLLSLVSLKACVIRESKEEEVFFTSIVPGDLLQLRAGDTIPADAILVEANQLHVLEGILTGESFPTEKKAYDTVFLGTIVISGMALAVVIKTGLRTQYGKLLDSAKFQTPKTAFEQGVKNFGKLLFSITVVVSSSAFILNSILGKPPLNSLLFALAIGVGLTPQLLPAIITVNLSKGARQMAKKNVVVKRLASIENFGQMDTLCADKTGTLTTGALKLDQYDFEKVKEYGTLNAYFQSSYLNPLDESLKKEALKPFLDWEKEEEIPYDFQRKRVSVLLKNQEKKILITKGAFPELLPFCNQIEKEDGSIEKIEAHLPFLEKTFTEKSREGKRIIAVAYGNSLEEKELIFLGFLFFLDPIKPKVAQTIEELADKKVLLKILTGDRHEVAFYVASQLGISFSSSITGKEIAQLSDEDLKRIVEEKSLFAEVNPEQKRRIVWAIRQNGHIVGYLGDGVNDLSALKVADVSITVDTAADAAKEISDIVLLKKDLKVLKEGVIEGRKTFINTMKYVYMASSANFGNMLSMTGASFFLSFLPLLPKQVLLTNFFSDLPEMALATDRVDQKLLENLFNGTYPKSSALC